MERENGRVVKKHTGQAEGRKEGKERRVESEVVRGSKRGP